MTSLSPWRSSAQQHATRYCPSYLPAMNTPRWGSTTRGGGAISPPLSTNGGNHSFVSTVTTTSALSSLDLHHPYCNVPPTIASKIGTNLHLKMHHPLNTIKHIIEDYWKNTTAATTPNSRNTPPFVIYDDLSPVVNTHHNFDSLLIPGDHVSRAPSDTYYLNEDTVLRTHTSAHQAELLRQGQRAFLVTGDVYRRDEIDRSHYPVFHQMEGVKIFSDDMMDGAVSEEDKIAIVEKDLKAGLEGMARALFGDLEMRWVDAYFPFTHPSYELEIRFTNNDSSEGEWLEVLGCGVIQQQILANASVSVKHGWAFGLGLERLAMILFSIPDIRLFWTDDDRFHSQFRHGEIVTFQPYSKYPPCLKDISFWIGGAEGVEEGALSSSFHPNDLNEIVRNIAGDMVECVTLIDEFQHPKTKRVSNCWRISYRSMERSLTNEEVDQFQERIREEVVKKLNVELR